MGHLFHLFGSDFKPSLPHPVLSLSISLSKVAGSFKCWLKSYLYLGKGAWWKELKGQILERDSVSLTVVSGTEARLESKPEYLHVRLPHYSTLPLHTDEIGLPFFGKLLCCNGSDVLGPEAAPYRTSSSLFYSCFNWLIHWN